jgi:hypothetical protein
MADAAIYLSKGGLATLWGVSNARVSQLCTEHQPASYRDAGVHLQPLLEIRPAIIDKAAFTAVLIGATAILDGKHVDAVAAAEKQALWELYSSVPIPRGVRGKAHKTIVAERENGTEAAQAALAARDRTDALASLRVRKLEAEIEGRELRTSRESGDLVRRTDVERDLKSAGAVVQSALGLLPSRIAELVPADQRVETMRRVEAAIERALYAVVTALGGADDE